MKLIRNPLFYKHVFGLIIPIALQNALFLLLNLMDTIMLGRVEQGTEAAISAANIANQPFFIYSLFIFGTVSGASVLISQYWGKGMPEKIVKVAGVAFTFCVSIGVIFTVVLSIIPGQVLQLYMKDKEVLELGTAYLRVVLISYIPSAISSILNGIMRSVENVRFPLFSSVCAVVFNIFFNWCFIFGRLGFPKLGVVGAAVGTLIARLLELVIVLTYVFAFDKRLKLRVTQMFRFEMEMVRNFIRYSLPVVLNETMWSLGITVHAAIIGNLGKQAYAAYTVADVVERVALILIMGFGNAGAIVIGKTVGAGDYDEAYDKAQTLLVLATGSGLVFGALVFLSRFFVLDFFNIEAVTKDFAGGILFVMSFMIAAKGFNTVNIVGILRGGGDTRVCLLLDVIPMWCVCIPLGAVAAFVLHLPVYFVYAILMSDEYLKLLFGLHRFRSKKWIKRIMPE